MKVGGKNEHGPNPRFYSGSDPSNSRGRLMRGSTRGCFWWSSACLFLSVWPGEQKAVKDSKLLIPGDNAGNDGGRLLRANKGEHL